ncbi:hypothetical protein OJF2_72590 [Aquisphaera giovannonii]|uniref:Uncharacterized protein n=1 Tax=Aquisphaera giovannonii TaxID=406548 RepID=A0A5B9WDW4_9BACT|nr:hypothetical protein [Aquisphaera giovannonii]QEH38653.1 hypothetical protein OJF2_72590 [Aquisphaera giovannonii]
MSSADRLAVVYATDENLAVRASGDFAFLCPTWQKLAWGNDGVLAASSPWVLRSASVNLSGAGVGPGHVALLSKPTTTFKGSGELFAVDAVAGDTMTLRRLGLDSGAGQPPSPAADLSGVEFLVTTLAPQIEEASFDLNQRLSIDPLVPGRTPGDLRDLRDLRQACVLTVLTRRYAAEVRGSQGDFALKLAETKQELGEILARLQLRWGPGATAEKTSTWLSTRIVR